MTDNCDRLMELLFCNPEREHIDVKFFVGGNLTAVTKESFCESGLAMLQQMHAKVGADENFHEDVKPVAACDLVAGR